MPLKMFQKGLRSAAQSLLKYGSLECAFLKGGLLITMMNRVAAAENMSALNGSYNDGLTFFGKLSGCGVFDVSYSDFYLISYSKAMSL